jgi:hypothetical protein
MTVIADHVNNFGRCHKEDEILDQPIAHGRRVAHVAGRMGISCAR